MAASLARRAAPGIGSLRTPAQNTASDPLPVFLDQRVQSILKKITEFDLNKITRPKKMPASKPEYRLLTSKQLETEQELAIQKAKERLQMPPVMAVREPIKEVLSHDPELEGLDDVNLVFTDICQDVSDRERFIVVREPSGTLRKATWQERDRLIQLYFPKEGKNLFTPKMFEYENLERLLEEEKYEYILDRACVQFDPDHEDYIRVTQRTYEHIEQTEKYEVLNSTRHFGPLAFYYAWYKKIDNLLVNMIQRQVISDAASLVHLYNIIHPNSDSASETKSVQDDLEVVKVFCQTSAGQKSKVELAIQTFEDGQMVKLKQ